MYPDLTDIATIREKASSAKSGRRDCIINTDREIDALLIMCDEIMRLATPPVNHYRLDLMHLGAASMRALKFNQVNDLRNLAEVDPADLPDFFINEGVKPPQGFEDWPAQAAELVKMIDGQLSMDVGPSITPDDDFYQLERIKGLGKATAQALKDIGVVDLADLAEWDPEEFAALVEEAGIKVKADVSAWPAQAVELLKGGEA